MLCKMLLAAARFIDRLMGWGPRQPYSWQPFEQNDTPLRIHAERAEDAWARQQQLVDLEVPRLSADEAARLAESDADRLASMFSYTPPADVDPSQLTVDVPRWPDHPNCPGSP